MNKRTKIVLITTIVIIFALIIGYFIRHSYANDNTNSNSENILFEDTGRYAFATAGSNLAYRGTSAGVGYYLITDYPENWDSIKQDIPSDVLSKINNMTGSYLNYDGKAKLGVLSTVIEDTTGNTDYDAVIIYPDGSYKIYEDVMNKTKEIEIKGKGWYYVSLLNADVRPHQSWAITTIYENDDITYNYVQLQKHDVVIAGSGNEYGLPNNFTIDIGDKYRYKSFINIYGLIAFGGYLGFPLPPDTNDSVWAILQDDTEYQLYDRGDGHFTGRTNTDFANNIYSTQRSTNLPGGEMDIFEEKLTTEYFDGKYIKGLKFQKDGTNYIGIRLVGFSVEIERLYVDVTLLKEDEISGAPINGAKFRLWGTSDNGEEVDKEVTSENGKVIFKDVPVGEYSLKETEAPGGYKLDPKTYTVEAGERYEEE